MIKSSLEKFDSPVVIVSQHYQGEEWHLIASYCSESDLSEHPNERFEKVGWHLSVGLPSGDDLELEQVFSGPEEALEFGISQILSGKLPSELESLEGSESPLQGFTRYRSLV